MLIGSDKANIVFETGPVFLHMHRATSHWNYGSNITVGNVLLRIL